jgi:hypothetical protein
VQFTESPVPAGWTLLDISVDGNPVDLAGVDFVAVAGKTYTIEITNWMPPPVDYDTITLEKWVDGIIISEWDNSTGHDIDDLIYGFDLYEYDRVNGARGRFIERGAINILTGRILFTQEHSPGWYLIEEVLTELGKTVFYAVEPLVFRWDGTRIIGEDSVQIVSDASINGAEIVGNVPGTAFTLPETWNNEMSARQVA